MSYAICRMAKINNSGINGIQYHNQREKESQTNNSIDENLSHLNYDLHNENKINFHGKINDIIQKNVITNRAIRKDAIKLCDIIITSDKKFFDGLTPAEQKEFFEESYNYFKDTYGEEKLVHATVHLDEKTPHMHIGLVPVTDDNRLSCKDVFNRTGLRDLQSGYHKYINNKGFELKRGIPSNKRGLSIQEFKRKTIVDDIKSKEQGVEALKEELETLKEELNQRYITKNEIKKVDELEVSQKLFNKDVVEIKKDDLDILKNIVKEYTHNLAILTKDRDKYKHQVDLFELISNTSDEHIEKKSLDNIQKDIKKDKQIQSLKYKLKINNNYLVIFKDFIRKKGLIKEFKQMLKTIDKTQER